MDEKRFFWITGEKEERLSSMSGVRLFVDSRTGVQYLFSWWGQVGGVTILVDRDGKPLLSDDERVWR